MRIGLVQPVVTVADFSANLRAVVQGARACTDAGAELLLAPAQALDGAFPGGLSTRSSFMLHARSALQALADELSVPMLLASYAGEPGERREFPSAYLLSGRNVRRMKRTVCLSGKRIAVCIGEQSLPPPGSADVCVLMPMTPWHAEQFSDFAQHAVQQSLRGVAMVVVQAVAWTDGLMLGGHSLVATDGALRCLLPSFQNGHTVWDMEDPGVQEEDPTRRTPQMLWKAVCFAVMQAVQQGGYRGVAVAETSPRARLLRSAACSAIGIRGVHSLSEVKGKSVRVSCAELQERAWERELLLLSSASREDILCGGSGFIDAGELAPFGDLYESEIAQLSTCVGLGSQLVHPSLRELALRALVDENRSPAEVAFKRGIDEGTLRALMRSIARTAASRHTFAQPVVVRTRRCAPALPRFHRLME